MDFDHSDIIISLKIVWSSISDFIVFHRCNTSVSFTKLVYHKYNNDCDGYCNYIKYYNTLFNWLIKFPSLLYMYIPISTVVAVQIINLIALKYLELSKLSSKY